MRSFTAALVLSAALVALVALGQLYVSPIWTAPATVLLGVLAASLVTGGLTWLSVVSGALGALAFGWLATISPSAAFVVLCASWLAPRAVLTRTQRDLVVFAAAAVPGAIVAGLVASYFAAAPFAQHLAACIFAGAALAISNVVVRVDAPLAHGLRTAGRALGGEVGPLLENAADAYGANAEASADRRLPRGKFKDLLRDADTRVALRGATGEEAERKRAELDARIRDQAEALRANEPTKESKQVGPPEPESHDEAEDKDVPPVEPTVEASGEESVEEEPRAAPAVQALVP